MGNPASSSLPMRSDEFSSFNIFNEDEISFEMDSSGEESGFSGFFDSDDELSIVSQDSEFDNVNMLESDFESDIDREEKTHKRHSNSDKKFGNDFGIPVEPVLLSYPDSDVEKPVARVTVTDVAQAIEDILLEILQDMQEKRVPYLKILKRYVFGNYSLR